VNTFTEHHGGPWSHKDMQHTMMVGNLPANVRVVDADVLDRACCGGLAGYWASSSAGKANGRSFQLSCQFPAIFELGDRTLLSLTETASIVMTGWGMSAHEQALMISSKASQTRSGRHTADNLADPRVVWIRSYRCRRFAHRRGVFPAERSTDSAWRRSGLPAFAALCEFPSCGKNTVADITTAARARRVCIGNRVHII